MATSAGVLERALGSDLHGVAKTHLPLHSESSGVVLVRRRPLLAAAGSAAVRFRRIRNPLRIGTTEY